MLLGSARPGGPPLVRRAGARGRVPAGMRSRPRTGWVVAVFIVVGVLLALVLIVRDLGDDDVPQEDGATPVSIR